MVPVSSHNVVLSLEVIFSEAEAEQNADAFIGFKLQNVTAGNWRLEPSDIDIDTMSRYSKWF